MVLDETVKLVSLLNLNPWVTCCFNILCDELLSAYKHFCLTRKYNAYLEENHLVTE